MGFFKKKGSDDSSAIQRKVLKGMVKKNLDHLTEQFKQDIYFEGWTQKAILLIMLLLSVYSIIRIIFRGIW